MPSAFAHAAAAVALGCVFRWKGAPRRFWLAGIGCAIAPDLDSIGFAFGIRYGGLLGHRGLSHSLAFALVLAIAASVTLFRKELREGLGARILPYLFLATASHGLLDAFTNGGLGIAFFSPFDATRHFFPFRPIEVSPINVRRVFQGRGPEVLLSEALWVGAPSLALVAIAEGCRAAFGRGRPAAWSKVQARS
jgi:inner membrane protein